MLTQLRHWRYLAAALAGAAAAALGVTVASSLASAPRELATSNLNTRAGKLTALEAHTLYQAGSFPVLLRVTSPDSTWAGSQWTTGSHGNRQFGFVGLGQGGTTSTSLPRGLVMIVSGFGAGPTVKATIARLRYGGSGVDYTAPEAARVAGFSGLAFDGKVWGKFGHTFVPFSAVTHGASPPDSWHPTQGELFHVAVVNVHGRTVVIFTESLELSPEDYATFLKASNRILASLRFPR